MSASRKVRLNGDTGLLKLIAMTTMLVDHLGAVVFPQYRVLRYIGRIAFPLYAYCLAVGCVYTRDMRKYGLRLLLLAAISQPIYVTAMGHQEMLSYDFAAYGFSPIQLINHYYLSHPGIMWSLLAGFLLIWTIKEQKYVLSLAVFAVIWYIQGNIDYGLKGVLLMLLFYALIDRPAASLCWVAAFMAWWGIGSIQKTISAETLNRASLSTQFYAVLSLPFIYVPTKTGIKLPKSAAYLFYPAHLILIYLIRLFILK